VMQNKEAKKRRMGKVWCLILSKYIYVINWTKIPK
jgi:hypothetical protein